MMSFAIYMDVNNFFVDLLLHWSIFALILPHYLDYLLKVIMLQFQVLGLSCLAMIRRDWLIKSFWILSSVQNPRVPLPRFFFGDDMQVDV